MSEILAPAGDMLSAMAAINAGADAIYLGLTNFSARSSAENFNAQSFKEAAEYAHAFGVKVYVAMNTLVKDSELAEYLRALVEVWNNGADAIIISDIFLGKYIKREFPEIVLHLSTQAGICNLSGAKLAKELGFSRVILARETVLEDIKSIAEVIETEVFVQGALCTCFSGQCYLSSFAGGNSGNRGKCKQPCRKLYSIDRDGFSSFAYRLSLSDLSVGENIKILEEAGVRSFKIEGRLRRAEYVSAAVKYCKNCLKSSRCDQDLSDLKRTFNRGNYTKGLAFGQSGGFISSSVQGHIGEFVGVVTVENGKYVCRTKQKFSVGDGFKVLRNGKEVGGGIFGGFLKNGFIVNTKARLANGDKVFVTTDTALNSKLSEKKRYINLRISARFVEDEVAEVHICGNTFKGDIPLSAAKNNPLKVEDLKNCFKKTDKYPFSVEFVDIEVGNVFMATSELNRFRREIYQQYFAFLSETKNVKYEFKGNLPEFSVGENRKSAIIASDLGGLHADIGILKISSFDGDIKALTDNFKGEKYLYLPPFATENEVNSFIEIAEKFDGIYCDGCYGFYVSERTGTPLFAGTGINISNRIGAEENGAKYFCMSKELSVKEISEFVKENSFYLSAGDIKVMDLIYCPFEKKCSGCDKRARYTLTDENNRKFSMRRYKTSECRFEVYNCAALAAENEFTGILADFSIRENAAALSESVGDAQKLKKKLGDCTRGHSNLPIL